MNRRVLIVAVVLVGAAALAWLATRIEQVTQTERVEYSGEARRNPFLAAQRLASRMGHTTREVKSMPDLDRLPAAGVLVLPNRRQALAPGLRARVLGWVARGGHLVIEAEYLAVSDPWLEALAVGRERAGEAAGRATRVRLPADSEPLAVSGLGHGMRLVAPDTAVVSRVETARGLQLVQLARGRGLVTVATDLGFARNPLIGAADNAEFFWRVVTAAPANRELAIYNRIERLSLRDWLAANAAAVLVSGAVLLVLWLWRAGPRFGPVAPDAPRTRRRLLEHLRAAGRFHWMRGGRERLLEAAREVCLARLARAQPGYASASLPERVARFAEYAGVTRDEAARLIAPTPVAGAGDFIALTRAYQQVHARLDRGM